MASVLNLGDDYAIDEDEDRFVIRHKPTNVEFVYDPSADEWSLSNLDVTSLSAGSASVDTAPSATTDVARLAELEGKADDPHDNTAHSETFLFDGESFDGLDTSELLNLLHIATQSIDNQDYNESVETHATASGTVTIDLSVANVHHVEAVDNITIAFANVSSAPPGNSVTIYVTDDDGAGPYTISWPTSVVWDGGDPVGEIAANSNVEVSLLTGDAGTEWRGRLSGEDFS